jgi:hypothetical protein
MGAPVSDPDPDVTPETPAPTPTPAAPAAPVATPTPTPTPPPAAPQTPPAPTPSADPAAQTQAAPAAPGYDSARDFVAKALGYKSDTYGDDESFLRAMVAGEQTLKRQLEEAKQLAQYGQLYLQNLPQKPAEPDKPDPFAAYKAPEFNNAWLSMVERTADGNIQLRPGADPSILPKIHAYQQYRDEVAQKLTTDPMGYLKPIIEHYAGEKAQALVEQQFAKMQADQYANSVIQQNADWMCQKDSNGRYLLNPATGMPMLSQAGERYAFYVKKAADRGMPQDMQVEYANALLSRDLYAPQAQSAAAVAQGDQAKQAIIQQMNRNGNRDGSMLGGTGNPAPPQNENLSITERLRYALRNHSDADFAASQP